MGQARSCSGVGYKHYFYAVETGTPDELSQHIEKWLQGIENAIAKELPGIIERILDNKHIDDNDRYILAALMSMLWVRSPQMRDQLNAIEEKMTKQIMGMYGSHGVDRFSKETGHPMTEEERAALIKTMEEGSYDLRFNNAQHLRFMTENLGFGGPGFTNLFYGHKWKIYIAKGQKKFITSDAPVVEWFPPPQTFYGASFLERNKYFALTPDIFIELTHPHGSEKVKRKTLYAGDDDVVSTFNILLADYAYEFAYSGERQLLEDLIAGRAKPGRPELNYLEKFKRPWDEAKKLRSRE